MQGLDVEALLDSTASSKEQEQSAKVTTANGDSPQNGSAYSRDRENNDRDRIDRDRGRNASRDRGSNRHRDRRHRDRSGGGGGGRGGHRRRSSSGDNNNNSTNNNNNVGHETPRSNAGSDKSRRRTSRSPRGSGRYSRHHRGGGGGDGDYYRRGSGGGGGGRSRSRSRSPDDSYRPRDRRDRYRRDRRDRDDRRSDRRGGGGGGGGDDDRRGPRNGAGRDRDGTPAPTEDERDRRTVFVQQIAARLRTRELKEFFEKVGPVAEAQIVKDRVSNRSKGVGYVEFKSEESVTAALQLTGQKLLGIPVIVQLTEAEKNRQVRNPEAATNQPNAVPFHRLYVGNIHFSITEQDLQNVFEPFGELEFVQLQKDDGGRSRGYGFVQFRDAGQAREALEKMNGFDLAGRPIRVGLGNDKFTPESTAHLMQKFQGQHPQLFQGSAFSGAGGRGLQPSNFDRAGGRESDKGTGAGALDDTDVAGVNFNNYSRDALMRKLARTDDPPTAAIPERQILKPKTEPPRPLPINVNLASRCVVLHNMFDPAEEEGDDWAKELEEDVRAEAEEKYGHVIHVAVDPNSAGDIYLKFDKVQGGENAMKGLNGRYFGGRMITAAPVVDAVYSSLFSRTKAI